MHPILFEIPGIGFPLRSFGVAVVAGFLLGTSVFTRLAHRYSTDPEKDAPGYAALPVWIMVGLLLGARLLYVVVEILQGTPVGESFTENPLRWFYYWEGGLVMYGGAAGAIVGGLWCAKKHGIAPFHALDIGLTAGFLGLAIGRIGCLLVGDDYGRRVPEGSEDLPFPIAIRVPDPLPDASLFGAENAGQVLYATQTWMTINAVLLFLIGLVLVKRRRYAGQAALWLLLFYAMTRSTIEHFRGDSVRGFWFGGAISTSQLISVGVGVTCLVLLFLGRKRPAQPAGT